MARRRSRSSVRLGLPALVLVGALTYFFPQLAPYLRDITQQRDLPKQSRTTASPAPRAPHSSTPQETDTATVERVVDGDTLEISLNGLKEKIRLIGVDTPESHQSAKLDRDAERTGQDKQTIRALGKQATAFTQSLAPPGTTIRLEHGQEARDRYGRVLAFVWLPDGTMLNEQIICQGFGNAYTRFPFKQEYMDRFRACEQEARAAKRGLWAGG